MFAVRQYLTNDEARASADQAYNIADFDTYGWSAGHAPYLSLLGLFLTPLKAPRPKGLPCPRAWLGAASGAGGAARTDAAWGGVIDTSELARSFQGKRHAPEAAALPRRGPRCWTAHAHWQSVEPNRAR